MDSARIIRLARERAGLSKRELARLAGTSPAAIVKYESGQTSPTVDTLNRIVSATGSSLEIKTSLRRTDQFERAQVCIELLEIVDVMDLKPAFDKVMFPRFLDVVSN